MVGLPYHDIKDNMGLSELLANGILENGSSWYDSSYEDNIIGFRIMTCDSYDQLDLMTVGANFEAKSKEFYSLTGQHGNLYMTLDVF